MALPRERNARSASWALGLLGSVALAALLLEALLPLLRSRYETFFARPPVPSPLDPAEAIRFVESKTFDPELGWDRDPIAHDFSPAKTYLAQSYGDSFVESGGTPLADSWQAHFERMTGEAIVNLGVGGYGLDQAVLKFEKYGGRFHTRVAILGLYNQTFRRALSYHPYYYFSNKEAFTFAFKPMFVGADGEYRLISPPCADAACLMHVLSDPRNEVHALLAEQDYWYRLNSTRPKYGFPNTLAFARILPEVLHDRRERDGRENYFFVTPRALDVAEYLVRRFVADSRKLGVQPLCLLLYAPRDLRVLRAGRRLDEQLVEFLRENQVPYIDSGRYILAHYLKDDGFEALSVPDGHLNAWGNILVAESLAEGFREMKISQ